MRRGAGGGLREWLVHLSPIAEEKTWNSERNGKHPTLGKPTPDPNLLGPHACPSQGELEKKNGNTWRGCFEDRQHLKRRKYHMGNFVVILGAEGLGAENCQNCIMFISHCETEKLCSFCFIKLPLGCFLVHPSILWRETHCKTYLCKLASWLCKTQSLLSSSAPGPPLKGAVPNSTGESLPHLHHPAGSEWTPETSKMKELHVSSWRAGGRAWDSLLP